MKKIAVIEKIHNDGLELLKRNKGYEYELITDVSENNLIKKLPEFDACTLRVSKLNENILKHCSKLKVISRHGVGYDNVDLDYIKKKNISLLITATANAVAVAEHVVYMMMSISKSINQYDNEVRSGNFKKNASQIETLELFNKGLFVSTGSFSKTSKPAPKIILSLIALFKSISLIIPPLEVFIIIAFFFIVLSLL